MNRTLGTYVRATSLCSLVADAIGRERVPADARLANQPVRGGHTHLGHLSGGHSGHLRCGTPSPPSPLSSRATWSRLLDPFVPPRAQILIFMDQQITAVIVNRKDNKLEVRSLSLSLPSNAVLLIASECVTIRTQEHVTMSTASVCCVACCAEGRGLPSGPARARHLHRPRVTLRPGAYVRAPRSDQIRDGFALVSGWCAARVVSGRNECACACA